MDNPHSRQTALDIVLLKELYYMKNEGNMLPLKKDSGCDGEIPTRSAGNWWVEAALYVLLEKIVAEGLEQLQKRNTIRLKG